MATSLDFPNISPPSYPFNEKYMDSTIRSSFENGTEQTRERYTRRIKEFPSASWQALRQAEYEQLDTFYSVTTSGGALSFNWTHPSTGVSKEVRFTGPPDATLIAPGIWQVKVGLREV